METGDEKDLRSAQVSGIISTKFLYFRYLNICFLEFLPQFLDLRLNRAMDVRKE